MKKNNLIFLFFFFSLSPSAADSLSDSSNDVSISGIDVIIDPAIKNQVIQGWGGSICWWGNILGNYSDSKIKTVCDWITDPVNGLNMNIFRFNIGGGDDPSHSHMRSDGGAMPGYKVSAAAPYNWNKDVAQRKVLKQLIASRIKKSGVNDIQLVAFANSPPYWMTRSGCVSGSLEGNVTNLKSDMFDDFADYLTEVSKYYHDSLGITFNYIEPFNEPVSTWWKVNGNQEGCYFSNRDQVVLIRALYQKMEEKRMLSYCQITANDANSIDECYSSLWYYKLAGDILPKVSLVAAHSYFGKNRAGLADFARANALNLWQSESGPLNVGGTDEFQIMTVSDRIITDIQDLRCTAWIDWQLMSSLSPPWGLITGDYSNTLTPFARAISFYVRAQYSRYIKIGYTIIGSSAANVLAAISPDEKELVVVISNKDTTTKNYQIDLSKFSGFGKVTKIRTRACESLGVKNSMTKFDLVGDSFSYDALSESVTTFVIPINQLVPVLQTKAAGSSFSSYLSNGQFYMHHPDAELCDISFYNTLGQCVLVRRNVSAQNSLPVNLLKGFYLVRVVVGNKIFVTRIKIA